MTDPDTIARWIAEQLIYVGLDRGKVQTAIAAALREYGEAEYLRGRLDEGQEAIKLWADLKAKADAEGYCRGVEEAAKIADEKCLGSTTGATNETCPTSTDIRALLQRGTGGGE